MNHPGHNSRPRWRWYALAGLLLCLGGIVLFSSPAAFRSPLAILVLSAIAAASILLEWYRQRRARRIPRASTWILMLGAACAATAIASDAVHVSARASLLPICLAVACFGIAGGLVLANMRKERVRP